MEKNINIETVIREKLRSQSLTISKLVEYTGVTRTRIYKIFSDNNTDINTLRKICDFLKIPISEFFSQNDLNLSNDNTDYKEMAEKSLVTIQILFVYEVLPAFYKYKDLIAKNPESHSDMMGEKRSLYSILGVKEPSWDEKTTEKEKMEFVLEINNEAINKLNNIAPHLTPVLMLGSKKWSRISADDYPMFVHYMLTLALRLPVGYQNVELN